MDTVFLLKLFLSFVIGGLWIVLATVLADKYGSKIGGLISGLPSTVLFSLFFLAWTHTPSFAVQSTTIAPIVAGVENLFALTYLFLVKKNLWFALVCSFFVWFVLALGLVYVKFNDFTISIIAYAISMVFFYWIVEDFLKIKSVTGKKIHYTPAIIFLRGLLSGLIIASIVILGKLGGPILGGAFSMFPAMYTATILITYFTQGSSFSSATLKTSIFSFFSGVIYTIAVRYTYIPLGIIWGTFVSAIISILSSLIVYQIIIKKLK